MGVPILLAGAKIWIGPAQTSEPANAAAYAALSWTEIGHVVNFGDLGDEYEVVKLTEVGDARVRNLAGAADAGTIQLSVADVPDDAGQIAAIAAAAARSTYAFKVQVPNKITPGGTGQIDYFLGMISSTRRGGGGANSVVTRSLNVAISTKLTTVAAT